MFVWMKLPALLALILVSVGCAPIESSVVIVGASQAIAAADVAGAGCTQRQLDLLSPITKNTSPDPGQELVSSEQDSVDSSGDQPQCDAPFEYYSAIEYLHKAREEVGFSDYQAAIEYARESRTYANKAKDIALMRNRERGR